VAYSRVLSRHFSVLIEENDEKSVSRSPSRDLNPGPTEYDAEC
jgi:hypothetical protein